MGSARFGSIPLLGMRVVLERDVACRNVLRNLQFTSEGCRSTTATAARNRAVKGNRARRQGD